MLRHLVAILVASLSVAPIAGGQGGANPALRNARRMTVIVEIEPDAARIGFDSSGMTKQVELVLRELGITSTAMADSSDGFLHVGVEANRASDVEMTAVNITVEFWAPMTLDRPPHGGLVTTAWSDGHLFLNNNRVWPSLAVAVFGAQLDKFARAWGRANP